MENHLESYTIKGYNLNSLVYDGIQRLYEKGQKQQTRNGEVLFLNEIDFILINPKARHLNLKGRTNNFFGTLGEMFWVMAGENSIKKLEMFVPRAKLYSDDGRVWNAAYGYRLWNYNQIEHLFQCFKNDGIETRRATASIFVPLIDTWDEYCDRYNTTKPLDIPCNQWLNFFVTKENSNYRLNLKVAQRSGDIIYGTGNINIPEFTFIQEFILCGLKEIFAEREESLDLGVYKHCVTNLHVYKDLEKQFLNIVNSKQQKDFREVESDLESHFPSIYDIHGDFKPERVKIFFRVLLDFFMAVKNGDYDELKDFDSIAYEVDKIFNEFMCETENNSIFAYSILILAFILSTFRKMEVCVDFYKDLRIYKTAKVDDLVYAVKNSKFRKFDLKGV